MELHENMGGSGKSRNNGRGTGTLVQWTTITGVALLQSGASTIPGNGG